MNKVEKFIKVHKLENSIPLTCLCNYQFKNEELFIGTESGWDYLQSNACSKCGRAGVTLAISNNAFTTKKWTNLINSLK